jgi:GNAT superfamily N-acetyltransferase
MKQRKLALSYAEITEADVSELTGVMTRAFDDDSQRHLGQPRGGPPGYDNGDFFRTWLFPYKESVGFKILANGKIIGALIVWILPGGHNNLGAMFVDPPYQDQDVGTRAWQFVEAIYPGTKSWTLETPAWATRNHGFYEKLGFRRVPPEVQKPSEENMVVYRKEMVAGTVPS